MGIFDKLMDTMHLGNDYEDDYDDYDDDFDDEPEPRGSLFKKKDKKYDYDLGDDGASGSEKVKPVKQQPARIMPMPVSYTHLDVYKRQVPFLDLKVKTGFFGKLKNLFK